MLYREIIVVCSEIHTKTQCRQNVKLLNVKHFGASRNQQVLKDNLVHTNYAERKIAILIAD